MTLELYILPVQSFKKITQTLQEISMFSMMVKARDTARCLSNHGFYKIMTKI